MDNIEELPQFELLKDLPGRKAGTKLGAYADIVDFDGTNTAEYYMYENYKRDSNINYTFTYHFMLDNPEWFKKLEK